MRIEKKRFSAIKQEWEALERQRKRLSPFHTYAFASCLYRGYLYLLGRVGIPEFYRISDKNELLMICPVVRNSVDGKTVYSSFGSKMAVVDEDFIYPDSISDETLFNCLCLLTEEFGTVSFEQVSEDSRIYSVGLQNGIIRNERKAENALITLPETYDEYYSKLSKNMRQTIRTAKNRLASDNMTDEVQIYYGNQMPKLDYLRVTMLYANSKAERYSSKQNRIKSAASWTYSAFFHHHAQALNKIDSSVCAVYRINNTPAAMLGGYLDRAGERVCWHRVGFDSRYSRYSPGIMLWQRTIEKMIDDTNVHLFDLSIGGEDYKYRIGAEAYYNRCFDIVPMRKTTFDVQ